MTHTENNKIESDWRHLVAMGMIIVILWALALNMVIVLYVGMFIVYVVAAITVLTYVLGEFAVFIQSQLRNPDVI